MSEVEPDDQNQAGQDSDEEGRQPQDRVTSDSDEDLPQLHPAPEEYRLFDPDGDQSRDMLDSDEHPR